jgi:hypothetical protein
VLSHHPMRKCSTGRYSLTSPKLGHDQKTAAKLRVCEA